ncbi:MAG: glucose-1-phosphate thymidylyltransferase, partial [Bacteroidetes bacterium]|nr:glucose-1-phosphate thymidylyltransferase [Bacteroidota bacterium]
MAGKNLILFDSNSQELLPLTYTRPVGELRAGILTIREKWELILDQKASFITEDHLSVKYPLNISDSNLLINGACLPNKDLISQIRSLVTGQGLSFEGQLIAAVTKEPTSIDFSSPSDLELIETSCTLISSPWQLFTQAGDFIELDIQLLGDKLKPGKLDDTNLIIGDGQIYIEDGASVTGATINTTKGAVYLGRNSEIMEGSLIRGPFVLGDHSVVKLGAKIYGPTIIGPHSKVGGELNNVLIQGYSSKAHDGFLGNSVIGEWCNLGADTNNSNLKNNYSEVKLWNYGSEKFEGTG